MAGNRKVLETEQQCGFQGNEKMKKFTIKCAELKD